MKYILSVVHEIQTVYLETLIEFNKQSDLIQNLSNVLQSSDDLNELEKRAENYIKSKNSEYRFMNKTKDSYMNSLELTKDHKSKLLEICHKLFPDQYVEFDDDFYTEGCNFLSFFDKPNAQIIEEIHWFEFCVRYIAIKIKADIGLFSHHTNPVDYLYEQFKINIQ